MGSCFATKPDRCRRACLNQPWISVGLWLLAAAALAAPRDPTAVQAEIDRLNKNILQVQQALKAQRSEHAVLLDELAAAERKVGERATLARLARAEFEQAQTQVKRVRNDIEIITDRITSNRAQLGQLILAQHALGPANSVRRWLNRDDSAQLGRQLAYHRFLGSQKRDQIDQLNANVLALASRETQLAEELTALQQRTERLDETIAAQQQALATRQAAVDQLTREIAIRGQALSELGLEKEEMAKLLDDLTRLLADIPALDPVKLVALKGSLPWPVAPAKLASVAGQSGVVIAADEGDPIRAIARGRVAYADWLRGFGLLLILDHGEGYMSLYGFCESLTRGVGDWVEAGESIATVGRSGGRATSGLYFEIRSDGEPVAPKAWLVKSQANP